MMHSHRFCVSTGLVLTLALLVRGGGNQLRAQAVVTPPEYWPSITLKTQDEKDIRCYEDLIQGKVVVIHFFYSRCQGKLCEQGLKKLESIQSGLGERLGKDVFVYSITLDPTNDTPAVLRDVAKAHNAKPGWMFLTGEPKEIDNMRRHVGMFKKDTKLDADRTQHSGMIKIGNDVTEVWTSISVQSEPERILELIQRVAGWD